MSSPLASPLSADGVSGYLHPGYAESLSEFGSPLLLPRSNGSILIRRIPDTEYHDATAPYPLLFCLDWSQLPVDLDALGTVSPSVHGAPNLVSMTAVTDPFADVDESLFRRSFVDVVRPFKEHFVVDLKGDFERSISSHHRRNARKAAKILEVTAHACSEHLLDDWLELYSNLIRRHHIRGVARFSRTSFERQFQVPGLVAFTATHNGQTVGMILWYVQSRRAYYHLGAYSDVGYELGASFALFTRAIEHFHAEGLDWLNLGAGAGLTVDSDDGLTRFKRGWASSTRTTYLCGRIFDQSTYDELSRAHAPAGTDFFPAYRVGEFT